MTIREEEIPIDTPRLSARLPASRRTALRSSAWLLLAAALLPILLAGCGGGGSSNTPPPPANNTLAGTVTDINGAPIVGAKVQMGSQSTTSTQFGAYALPIPAVQAATTETVTASATINGQNWSGQNVVEVLPNQPTTPNAQIVLSSTATQGAISGLVQDSAGHPLQNARVFAAAPATATSYSTLSSFVAFTDANGKFTMARMPPLAGGSAYTVTASQNGYTNASANVTVTAGQQASVTLTLTASGTGTKLPPPQNLSAQSLTLPTVPTRAVGTFTDRALNAIRHFILARRGLLGYRSADPTHVTLRHRLISRNPPAGSLIENDMFWDYAPYNTLYGYDILRSVANETSFVSIALLRDPLADRFADSDSVLTPDTLYYYSLARLDTIGYPANGQEGDPVNPPVAVQPLGPISLSQPANSATVSATPALSWTSVSRAAGYQILVYAQFPDYQSDTDPNGVKPIWPQDISNPGASLVSTTSQTYQGPALQSGHTYYWAVLAVDQAGSAFSISPIRSFIVQ